LIFIVVFSEKMLERFGINELQTFNLRN